MAQYDYAILCRNCEEETMPALPCQVTGTLPSWLLGKVVYNGPGKNIIGKQQYNHTFDGAALLQKFDITPSGVKYSTRFVNSSVFKENEEAGCITRSGFGTAAVSQGLFSRLRNAVNPEKMLSDNTQLSVHRFGQEYYALGEIPFMFKVDINTLETSDKEKINLNKLYGLVTMSPHPLTDEEGNTYIIGQGVGITGPKYNVIKFGPEADMKKGTVVLSIPCRWRMSPCYIHSLGMTENYLLVVEQPLAVSMSEIMSDIIKNVPFIQALNWYQEDTLIHVVDRRTWQKLPHKYVTKELFMLHFSNLYDDGQHIVFEAPLYEDSSILHNMYIKKLQGEIGETPYDTYLESFISRLTRFVVPLHCEEEGELTNSINPKCKATKNNKNQVRLEGHQLVDFASENPVINPKYTNKKHTYVWAMGPSPSKGDLGHITKINVDKIEYISFQEDGLYTGQPIFVPNPDGKNEDDGVLLAVILRSDNKNFVGLIALDASTMKEIARITVQTKCANPMPLHGSFFT